MGATNFLAVLGYVGGGTVNMINGCIAAAIAFAVTAVLTYLSVLIKQKVFCKEIRWFL